MGINFLENKHPQWRRARLDSVQSLTLLGVTVCQVLSTLSLALARLKCDWAWQCAKLQDVGRGSVPSPGHAGSDISQT